MQKRSLSKLLLVFLLAAALFSMLAIIASARSVFQKNFMVSGLSLATSPGAGVMSYAYPGSDRTGAPGNAGPTYGLDVNDGCAVDPGPDGKPYTDDDVIENGFLVPRDFSLEMTYTLTEAEALLADLSETPVFGLRMGTSNTMNLVPSQYKYKVVFYTSADEKIEVVREAVLNLDNTVFFDLSAEVSALTDKTIEKIVFYPFFDVYDRPITNTKFQTKFLLRKFGFYKTVNEADLALTNKIQYTENLSVNTSTPDATIAVVTSLLNINTKPAQISALADWIVTNKDSQNIKLVPIVGNTTVNVQNYDYAAANTVLSISGYSKIADYLNALLKNPQLYIIKKAASGDTPAEYTTQSSGPIHAVYKNVADAFRPVSAAGIHLSVAYYHFDVISTQTRNHILWDAYFRYSASDVEDFMGVPANGFSNVSYNRVNINPTGTAGVDFGQFDPSVRFDYNKPISGGVKNTWYTFSAGGQDYMAISLEMHPTKEVRSWFKTLVQNNPDKKIIVITTGYMDVEGKLYTIWDDEKQVIAPETVYNTATPPAISFLAGTAYYPTQGSYYAIWKPAKDTVFNGIVSPGNALAMKFFTTSMQTAIWSDATDGDMFWNNYLSRYQNIYMIIDGGDSNNGNAALSVSNPTGTQLVRPITAPYALDVVTREDVGLYGNTVYTIQANPTVYVTEHGALLLVKFRSAEKKVEISYYLPELDAYINPANNIFTLDNLPANPEAPYGLSVSAGKISGLDSAKVYCYRPVGADRFIEVPDYATSITGLAAGIYEVAYRQNAEYMTSEVVRYFVPAADHNPRPMDWNMIFFAMKSQAALDDLGYSNTGANALQVNRTAYFNEYHDTVYKAGTAEGNPGEWIWVQSSPNITAFIGYDMGMFASRSNEIRNHLQHWTYIFRDDEKFDVKDRPYFVLNLSYHGIEANYPEYKAALQAEGVRPTSRVLIYIHGRKEPYEIIREQLTQAAITTFNVKIPSEITGYIEKIEVYPMYRYFPEPDSPTSFVNPDGIAENGDDYWICHLNDRMYTIPKGSSAIATNFYTGFGNHIRQIAFVSSEFDANIIAAGTHNSTSPSFSRFRLTSVLSPDTAAKPGDFTIAIMPNLVNIASNKAKIDAMTGWIVENKNSWNIKMASSVGMHTSKATYAKYWTTGANLATAFGYSDQTAKPLTDHTKETLYLASIGGIKLADGSYDTSVRTESQNIALSLSQITDAMIPLSISASMYDNLGGYTRGKILDYYINVSDLHQTGYLDTGLNFTVDGFKTSPNLMKLVADGKITVDENGVNEFYKDLKTSENTYYTFTEGGTDYMVVSLEAWPRGIVRTWANDLIAANSNKRVIVIVPEFYNKTGTALINCWATPRPDLNDWTISYNGLPTDTVKRNFNGTNIGDPLDGSEIWRLVLQKHSNIILIYDAGIHVNTLAENTTNGIKHFELLGVNGNTVHVIHGSLVNYYSTVGNMILLKFSENGSKVDVIASIPEQNVYGTELLNKKIVFETYDVSVDASVSGIEEVSNVSAGQKVTLSVTPPSGKKVKEGSLKIAYTTVGDFFTDIINAGNNEHYQQYTNAVEKILLADKNGEYSFTMPDSDVVVTSVEYVDIHAPNIALSAAGVRLDGAQGMRFLATFYLDGIDSTYKSLWTYGVLMVPTSLLDAGGFDLSFSQNGELNDLILNIPMINYYYYAVSQSTGKGYFHFTGVLNGIPVEGYDTKLSAVAYVRYTLDGTNFSYAYSDVFERSFRDVVKAAYLSGRETTANENKLNSLIKATAD